MLIPEPRYYLRETLISISNKLDWPYEDWMQDWPLEIWANIDIDKCILEYSKLNDEDEKYVIMQGILYALEEMEQGEYQKYIPQVENFLKVDISIHHYTIYYWSLHCSSYEEGIHLDIGSIMKKLLVSTENVSK